MKPFISIALLLLSGTVYAKKASFPAEIFKHDGERIECLIFKPDIQDRTIQYKINKEAKEQYLSSSDIQRIVIYQDEENPLEIEYMPTYSLTGMGNKIQAARLGKPLWMAVVIRGSVSLYTYRVFMNPGDYSYYYCKRADEEAASMLSCLSNKKMQVKAITAFAKIGSAYFEDNAEISQKIKNKEKGYKQDDIISVVLEYNAFKN
jgi:hypothetical protein